MSSGHGSDVDAGNPWRLLFARWKLACLIAALCFSGLCLCINSLKPLYKANVQFLLPVSPVEDPSDRKNTVQTQTDMFIVRSYSEVVRDPTLCQKVIDRLQLSRSQEFKLAPSILSRSLAWLESLLGSVKPIVDPVFEADIIRDTLLQRYKGRLLAVNDNKSLILDLSFEAADPYLATKIVNAHADAFIAAEIEYRRQENQVKTKWMMAELDRSAEEVRAAQIAIQLHPSNVGSTRDIAANQTSDFKFREMMAASKRTVYEGLLAKYQTKLAEQTYSGSEIRILSHANVPSQPAFPRKLLFAAAAAGISLVLGFIVALITTVLRRTESLEAFAAAEGIDIIGRLNVPRRRWLGQFARGARLRRAYFWEQIREIRSGIGMFETQATVIAVTSALPQEGKSVIAAALARSIACSGTRTLLLDANLRSPSFYSPSNATFDLRSYFEGSASAIQSLALVDPSMPLYLLCSSKEDRLVNVDALSGSKMRVLLDELKRSFSVIIIDTPAMSIVSDAFFVAALADEVVVTAWSDQQSHGKLMESLANLRRRCVSIRGLIITDRKKPAYASCAQLRDYITGERILDIWPVVT